MNVEDGALEVCGTRVGGCAAMPQNSQRGGSPQRGEGVVAMLGKQTSVAKGQRTKGRSASADAMVKSKKKRAYKDATAPVSLLPRRVAVEVALVSNLKKQVACLEAQVLCLKKQIETDRSARHLRKQGGSPEVSSVKKTPAVVSGEKRSPTLDSSLPLADARRSPFRIMGRSPMRSAAEHVTAQLLACSAPVQLEVTSLQFQVDSLVTDVAGLQTIVLNVERERDAMAKELTELRATLREAKREQDAGSREREALTSMLEHEQALRRSAEEQLMRKPVSESPVVAHSSSRADDMMCQRDFFKLQSERLQQSVTLLKARTASLEEGLCAERNTASSLETELCAALDRVDLLNRRDDQLSLFYQQLGARFIAVCSTLRTILDAESDVAANFLRQSAASGEGPSLSLEEVRSALSTWPQEAQSALGEEVPKASGDCVTPSPASLVTPSIAEHMASQPLTPQTHTTASLPQIPSHSMVVKEMTKCVSKEVESLPSVSQRIIIEPPPAAAVPAPPAAAVPVPPAAAVPAPPAAAVPVPPAAAVPAPPAAAVPAPPAAAVPLGTLGVVEGGGIPEPPAPLSFADQISLLDSQIEKEESVLTELVKHLSS